MCMRPSSNVISRLTKAWIESVQIVMTHPVLIIEISGVQVLLPGLLIRI